MFIISPFSQISLLYLSIYKKNIILIILSYLKDLKIVV
ncbi:hypothetical protein DOT_0704 [Desulfosporosinus sp. OT]|nr:hypothetical protein DOT_0704 [Desulfosporosinus sp. OT]